MANQEQLELLRQGSSIWNQWRELHSNETIDLRGADLSQSDLSRADLRGADLREATLLRAYLYKANLERADLSDANLSKTILNEANLSEANLSRANLRRATLIETNLTQAILTDCSIYGIAAWKLQLEGAQQFNLIITPINEPTITVDNLEVAQFIYLLLDNTKTRDVIHTLTTKAVLLLGRFTPERKVVLKAIRDALRTLGYLPILFDFQTPSSRNVTETVSTLAHLAYFIIADLTDPSSIPHELGTIVPRLAVPVQPIIEDANTEYSMFLDLYIYHWVLPIYRYANLPTLLTALQERVIAPAERKALELVKPQQ